MEILLTNVGQDPIEIEADDWNLARYMDAHRASDFKINCARRIPVKPYARIVASEGNETLFRGYVQKPKIKNKNARELNCKGEEDLLLRRHTGRYSYAPSTHALLHAFASDAPNQAADAYGKIQNVGLIWMANSMIPFHGMQLVAGDPHYDWFYHGHNYIFQLEGLGTNSRIGTVAIYSEGLLLPRVADFATLEATTLSSWSDANDLWVRCDDAVYSHGFGPRKMLGAHLCYETGVRMGNIAKPTTYMAGNFQGEFDRILDIMIDIAEFHSTIPFFRYSRDYTYFDTLEGYPESEFFLPEEHVREITQSIATDQKVHALIGRGLGSRDVRQIYTPSDHTWKGIWYQETYDVEDGHLDVSGFLKKVVDAEYVRLLGDEVFSVTPSEDWPHTPAPGDMVRLALEGESQKLLQVASAKTSLKSSPEYDLGARKSDIIDAFNAKSSLSRVYTEEFLKKSSIPISGSGILITGDLTHGWCTGYTATFTVPDSVRSADYSHRVFLDLSISADMDPEPLLVDIQVNDSGNIYTQPCHYLAGDSITKLDITRLVLYGSESTLKVYVKRKSDWPTHANCGAHPTMDISYTVTCYRGTSPWVNPIPPEGEGQYIIRPIGPGVQNTIWGPTANKNLHWQQVDEVDADGNTTTVWALNPSSGTDLYELTAIPEENEYGNVQSVTVYTRCYHSPGEGYYRSKAALYVGGTIYYGNPRAPTGSYQTYSDNWDENPKTGLPWTWGDIRDIQAGVYLLATNSTGQVTCRCTQVYVIVGFA